MAQLVSSHQMAHFEDDDMDLEVWNADSIPVHSEVLIPKPERTKERSKSGSKKRHAKESSSSSSKPNQVVKSSQSKPSRTSSKLPKDKHRKRASLLDVDLDDSTVSTGQKQKYMPFDFSF